MSVSLISNPATNNNSDNNEEDRGSLSFYNPKKWEWKDYVSAALTAYDAAKGVGKYALNTFTAEKNNVPLSTRLAVGAAENAEDKLRTLRQFHPEARPSGNNDFIILDPVTKKQVTLNDPGASLGDIAESVPEIGETVGSIIGGIGGGTIGSLVGPAGTAVGGIAGSGIGGAAGSELARQGAQALASALTGKEKIDTRTSSDMWKKALSTGVLNSAFASVPFLGRAIRNNGIGIGGARLVSGVNQNLAPEGAASYQYFKSKGYEPTLGMVGSPSGKELYERQLQNKILGSELNNKEVLQNNMGNVLGKDLAGMDENALANRLRDLEIGRTQASKDGARDLYSKFSFGDDIANTSNSKKIIEDVYNKRGLSFDNKTGYWSPIKGESLNPDFMFDTSIERKMGRVMQGKATERELGSFRSDLGSLLRDRNLKYDSRGALSGLKDSLTKDLTLGNPSMSEADRAARSAWMKHKEDEEVAKNILGRSYGVNDGTKVGQGVTEGQSLGNLKNVYSVGKTGSDSEANALGNFLTPDEKKAAIVSMLKENQTYRGFKNPLAAAQDKYNFDRVGKTLTSSDAEREALSDLLKQSRGVAGIPDYYPNRAPSLNAEAALLGGATIADPKLGAMVGTALNSYGGAPGTTGGAGAALTSLYRNNPAANWMRQRQANSVVNAARLGEIPGKLNYMPSSPYTIPATQLGGQFSFGNIVDSDTESNKRIPKDVRNENIPDKYLRKQVPASLEPQLKYQGPSRPDVDLNKLLGDDISDKKTAPKKEEVYYSPDETGVRVPSVDPIPRSIDQYI